MSAGEIGAQEIGAREIGAVDGRLATEPAPTPLSATPPSATPRTGPRTTAISRIPVSTLAMLALLGYCVATAVSATWVTFSFGDVSSEALTFTTFLIAQAVYLVFARRRLPEVVRFVAANPKDVAILNVLTLASWLFMFMALQRIEASVESAVYQGAVAVGGVALASAAGGSRFRRATWWGVTVAVASLGLLVVVRLTAKSDSGTPLHSSAVSVGLALALVAGSLGSVYIYCSSVLHRRVNAPTSTILCVRFGLLLVVTGALGGGDVLRLLGSDPATVLRLVGLAVTFVVLPTVLLQWAIAKLPSARVSVVTPLVPVFALGPEYVFHPWGALAAPLLVGAASAALIYTNFTLSRGSLTSRASDHHVPPKEGTAQR